jgi:hypothetical protein
LKTIVLISLLLLSIIGLIKLIWVFIVEYSTKI